MSNLKIGPAITTKNRSGAVNVSCEFPGEISLSCDDPNVTLGASSVTVGGVLDRYCQCEWTRGLARRDSTLSRSDNFAVAFEFQVLSTTPPWWSTLPTYFLFNKHYGSDAVSGGWGFYYNYNSRKLAYYSYSTAPTGGAFAATIPAGEWVKCVITFSGTSVRLRTSITSDETLTRGTPTSPAWDGVGYEQYGETRIVASLNAGHPLRVRNFQFIRDALPSDTGDNSVAAFLAGTGDIASSLLVKLPMMEESGETAYDQSGNGKNFTVGVNSSGTAWPAPIHCGLTRVFTTPLSNSEHSVTWSIPDDYEPDTFTITATRTKAGFPASIATETDTCAIVFAGVDVEGVTLNKAETEIAIGSSETLVATVWPDDASEKGVTWSSSNMGVASVLSGVVTANSRGSAVITATTVDGFKTATCAITVPAADPVFGDVVENTLPALLPRALQTEHNSRSWANVWQERFNGDTTGLVDLLQVALAVYDIENQTSDVLDAIADSFGVFGWEFGVSITEKRAFLAKVLEIQQKIGTPWAIEQAIRLVVPTAWIDAIFITEGAGGWTFNGSVDFDGSHYYDSAYHWAKFAVLIHFSGPTSAQMEALRPAIESMCNHYKPVRCQLHELSFLEV